MKNYLVLLLPLICLFTLPSGITKNNGTFFIGYQLNAKTGVSYKINYTKSYEEVGLTYTTIYKLFNRVKGTHEMTVTAVHDKNAKKIKVTVNDPSSGIFGVNHTEEYTYQEPENGLFGIGGAAKTLGGSKIPNQLSLKFVSNKYENVLVYEVLYSPEDFEWFILQE